MPKTTWEVPNRTFRNNLRPELRLALLVLLCLGGTTHAEQFVIPGPPDSGTFGSEVFVLPNGNIVVTDPGFDLGSISNVGAVYLYRPNGTLISTLRGSSAEDRVGSSGIVILPNSNYLVVSVGWDNGTAINAGAVTFASGTSGVSGVVSASNSLVGSTTNDSVGFFRVTVLTTGNYVVRNRQWDNGSIIDAGAVTFGSGTSGVSGVISATNSLVGSSMDDRVGSEPLTVLPNGNYLVKSRDWNNGDIANAGAVTFGSGSVGISGVLSPANSLVGSSADDHVGRYGIVVLTNGNYLVCSDYWDNGEIADAGAVTLGSGSTGISGLIKPTNSLVGSRTSEFVGGRGAWPLKNGNYVVNTPTWMDAAGRRVGAVTFGSGTVGITGIISSDNSLIGTTENDDLGNVGLSALANGNYVVISSKWDNGGISDAGAVTFGSGVHGITGTVSPANSLIGNTSADAVGSAGVVALPNGDYVVSSPLWDHGTVRDVGAVTHVSGISGMTGAVSPANSLVGSAQSDQVGSAGVLVLTNGNYVVSSPRWNKGTLTDVGAVTFVLGSGGIAGAVSPTNSLVGSSFLDQVGEGPVTALTNGNYVVSSMKWDHGGIVDAGAATFGSGTTGISGEVSSGNSLVGSSERDNVGGVRVLKSSDYVVTSPIWDSLTIPDVGAVTYGSGTSGISGLISASNSLLGSSQGDFHAGIGIIPLSNDRYAVSSTSWDHGGLINVGAVTFSSASGGITGFVSPANSLIGRHPGDAISSVYSRSLPNGQFLVSSEYVDHNGVIDVGATSIGLSDGSLVGEITEQNSVFGVVYDPFDSDNVLSNDILRGQVAVGQPAANRVILARSGIATDITLTDETPDPALSGQPVTFTAIVVASPGAPTNGQVRFAASSGEVCIDTTPMPIWADSAEFSCAITFTQGGVSTVVAEYIGSTDFAYSGTDPEPHTTINSLFFADGFEGP